MISFYESDRGFNSTPEWKPECWVRVDCLNDEDRTFLIEKFGAPVAFLNDIEDIDERPRIEYENGWFLIILRVPYKSNDENQPFITVPLGLIFKENVFISVCVYQTEMLQDFVLYTKRKQLTVRNNFDLVLKLILSSSVWFLKYLKQINQQIKIAELKLEKSIQNEDLQTLLRIEKCMVYFTTSLKGNDILIHRLKNLKDYKDTYDPELVEDVEIELRQAQETTNIYSDILSGMMDAYASVISNNLNVIMKILTSISIILMIPTLVASLYGMNVHNNLENNTWGFWIILGVSIFLSLVGIMMFKIKKWF